MMEVTGVMPPGRITGHNARSTLQVMRKFRYGIMKNACVMGKRIELKQWPILKG